MVMIARPDHPRGPTAATARRRGSAAVVAVAVALALALSGCTAFGPSPIAPHGLTQPDKAGAAAAAEYFVALRQSTLSSGDTATWLGHTDPSCRKCSAWAAVIDLMYQVGGRFETSGVSIVETHVRTVDPARGAATVTVASTRGRVDVYDIDGEPNQTFPPAKATETLELRFFEGSWHLLSWDDD